MPPHAPGAEEMKAELHGRQRRMPPNALGAADRAGRGGRDRSQASPRGRGGSRGATASGRARLASTLKVEGGEPPVTRRRAQWRADHGLPPREEEWAQDAAATAAAAAQQDEEEVELGQADFSTDSPPRGAARWRHGGHKSEYLCRMTPRELRDQEKGDCEW